MTICTCLIPLFLCAGITAAIIYFYFIKPKLDMQVQENYIQFGGYRPSDKYRHQYFWKRPFLRYPFSFRRPFDYYRQILYPQQPLEAVPMSLYNPDPQTGSCTQIPLITNGTARINNPRLGTNWTISFDMKFFPDMSEDDKLVFRVGQAYPSPMMAYSPIDNTLTMILYTYFNGYTNRIIQLHDLDVSQWNNFTWVQNGPWTTVYVNGIKKMHSNIGSAPKISPGSFYLDTTPFVIYKNVRVCDFPWNRQRLNDYLQANR